MLNSASNGGKHHPFPLPSSSLCTPCRSIKPLHPHHHRLKGQYHEGHRAVPHRRKPALPASFPKRRKETSITPGRPCHMSHTRSAAVAVCCSSRQLCTASFFRWSKNTCRLTSSVMITSLLIAAVEL